jgi:aldehyde:ferredoxin oxidoreductase
MGSKRLKAVAVRGAGKVQAANAELLKQISKEFAAKGKTVEWLKMGTGSRAMNYLVSTGNLPVRNFRDGAFPNAINLDGETLLNQMGHGMDACFACAVRCKKRIGAKEPYEIDPEYGGPEYESIASLGSACGIEDGAGMCKANELCNAYALDSISTGVTIAFAMECFEEGLLSLEDTQGIELRFGSVEALLEMIRKIAYREGLGAILADGPAVAAERIGGDAAKYAIHVKNQPFPAHEPRLKRSLTFGYAVSPTGADHIQAMQDHALSVEAADGLPADPMLRGLGLLKPLEKNDIGYEKVRASVYYSMVIGLLNSLVFCHLVQLGVEMSVEDKTRLVRAATGWDVSVFELLKVGERAMTLARLYNMREGLTASDDRLPERVYQPTRDGALADVHIDRQAVQEAIHLYYAMMGWDQATGVPLEGKLHELGLSWAIAHLPKGKPSR